MNRLICKKNIKWILLGIFIIAVLLIMFVPGSKGNMSVVPSTNDGARSKDYQQYLDENGYDGTLSDSEIAVDILNYKADASLGAKTDGKAVETGSDGTISWTFEAKTSGFYNIELCYEALPGTISDIQREVLIDGKLPYSEMGQIVLKRLWQDDAIETKNGNEIRPDSHEIYESRTVYLEDCNRRSSAPLLVYLNKGRHTVAFSALKEPVKYISLSFKAAKAPKSYDEVLSEWKSLGLNAYGGEAIVCQAERTDGNTLNIVKTSTSINIKKNYSDSNLQPYHPWRVVYNTIGAGSWKQPGDAVEWEISVPEDGLYTISFKGRQSSNRGVISYRRLYVNGEVPFAEMNAIGFEYSSDFKNYTVSDENGEPYYFYLKKGTNTITLETVLGSFGEILNEVEESLSVFNQTYLKVISLTGKSPDRYIDYEISKQIPEFSQTMKDESERLYRLIDKLIEITGEKGENTSLLEKMAVEAKALSEDPERVVDELEQFKNNISALGAWTVNISAMPLELDSIVISGDFKNLPPAQALNFTNFKNGVVRFFSTFFVKTSDIGASEGGKGSEIKVWMASSGREQAQIIQNLIDEKFTPETGISVKLQLIPVDVVLRAALAGNGPDVVIGLSQSTSQDFAMRGAVEDLSQLKGFDSFVSKYYPGVLDTAKYGDGIYGIPEQANIMMLFYRTDILKKIGADAPKTWEDVKNLIPLLQKNNYDFYLPSTLSGVKLYESIVFQYGGDVYEGKGADYGIKSALSEEPAMLAFKDYTDLFTSYGLLTSADFSNRFRTGEMPLGIADYTLFNQLEIFAPEIKGLWGFSPIPGYEKDGNINKSGIVETVQSVIMKGRGKTEASWEFLKWWNDTQTQLSYANTLESVMGTAARYPAADPEVLKQLPWSNSELKKILEQMNDAVGIPAVPGYYMTTRMIQYAFNDVVADMSNPRETLYLNIKDIDTELEKKREEFGLKSSGQAQP